MKTIRELLEDADPIRHEGPRTVDQLHFRRLAVMEVASGDPVRTGARARPRILVLAIIASILIAASVLGSRLWSVFVGDLQAAVRFEVRLAEDTPAPGLRQAKVAGSDRSVYLYDEAVVTNGDIAAARVVQGREPSDYSISIEFNRSGADKMRAATRNHIGRPVAVLLDGQVAMAPVLRSPIDASARITGEFTRAQAERIADGIVGR